MGYTKLGHTNACETCGKPFYVPLYKLKDGFGKFCSRKCMGNKRTTEGRITKTCDVCGESYSAKKSRIEEGQHTCSPECALIARAKLRERPWLHKTCAICGTEYKVVPSRDDSKYCSRQCFAQREITEAQRDARSKATTTWFAKNRQARAFTCVGCGTECDARSPADAVWRKYCSTKCANGSEVARKDKSHAAASKKNSFKPSKLEIAVRAKLEAMGISFIPQFPLHFQGGRRAFCIDVMLMCGVALEINGTYWHCDPRKYPNGPCNDTQKRGILRVAEKRKALAANGIQLLEIWEMDFILDPDKAVLDVLKTCSYRSAEPDIIASYRSLRLPKTKQ